MYLLSRNQNEIRYSRYISELPINNIPYRLYLAKPGTRIVILKQIFEVRYLLCSPSPRKFKGNVKAVRFPKLK